MQSKPSTPDNQESPEASAAPSPDASEELQRLNAELSQQALHVREVNQTLLDS